MPRGTHYALVAGDHVDPALGTVQITESAPPHTLDVTVTDWRDPAGTTYESA